ncbi:MAG: sigma 54-interacting transcriptional regulator [bacterium]
MEPQVIINFLRQIDIFDSIPSVMLPHIVTEFVTFTTRSFAPGEIAIKQNQEFDHFYLIYKGQFEVYFYDQTGAKNRVSYLLPTEYFGDFYLLTNRPSTTEIIAVKESQCLCLSREHFFKLFNIDQEISQNILRSLLRQVYKTNIIEETAVLKDKALQFLQQTKKNWQYAQLIGKSKEIRHVGDKINQIAQDTKPIVIQGENGTGKELAAMIIHNNSLRSAQPFISVDCEKLAPDAMKAQLFGDPPFYRYSQKPLVQGFSHIELAEKGTLLLKNIEALPLKIQLRIREMLLAQGVKGKRETSSYIPDVRLIVTTRIDLKSLTQDGKIDSKLYKLLSANSIYLPPLRERKKDIPDLVYYFVEKYSKYYQKDVHNVSISAMKKLLAHDYKLGNILELEGVIGRAVNLPRTDTIRSEHIFLGLPASKSLVLYNLLRIDTFSSWVKQKLFPEIVRGTVAVIFLFIIGFALFAHNPPFTDIIKILVWGIWWPVMFVSFFFIGRLWCSICPYATYSHLVKKLLCKERNFPLKKYDYLFMSLGFLFVIWVEEVSRMRHSSFRTGILQLSIITLAVLTAAIYKRDSWCRFICPLGGLISICSMASVIELRSTQDVCINQCTTHNCYRGSDNAIGCPMFQHLMYVDNNLTCKLCLNCVRSCPHESISLNIRPPATEIWNSNQLNKGLFLFVVALMSVLVPNLLMEKHIISHAYTLYTAIFLLTPCIILAILWVSAKVGLTNQDISAYDIFWRTTFAYVPLILTAHIAYQIQFFPVVSNLFFSLQLSPSLNANIIVYSKSLFHLVKTMYVIFEFIIYVNLFLYILFKLKELNLKEGKKILYKPALSIILFIAALYFLPLTNKYVFNKLTPIRDQTTIIYNVALFHIIQLLLFCIGIFFSLFSMVKILKKFTDLERKSKKIFLSLHFFYMLVYSGVILFLLFI